MEIIEDRNILEIDTAIVSMAIGKQNGKRTIIVSSHQTGLRAFLDMKIIIEIRELADELENILKENEQ